MKVLLSSDQQLRSLSKIFRTVSLELKMKIETKVNDIDLVSPFNGVPHHPTLLYSEKKLHLINILV